jgi:hypothetical protein
MNRYTLLIALLALAGCAAEPETDESPAPEGLADVEDLPVGDLLPEDAKADGNWTHALRCKPVPDLPPLTAPEIYVSIEGLTLRLVDKPSGFEKVFPIGPGAIDRVGPVTQGESYSMFPVLRYGRSTFEITPQTIQPCKIWLTENGRRTPVFAGMPFLSFSGNYGIHGPIDNFNAPNGGNLRRGFVSHGCLRMESEGILELYARIKGVRKVPVHVQREVERRADGTRVDIEQKWVGSECEADDDCNFDGGVCKLNAFSGRGFCTAKCTRACADLPGQPTTFCVADPDDAGQGICVNKLAGQNPDCRAYDHFVPRRMSRFGQPEVKADVCLPGSRGWVGTHCFDNGDCAAGNTCEGATDEAPGLCTQACTRFCADQPGFPTTMCADEPAFAGPACLSRCTPASNAPECATGTECVERRRPNGAAGGFVCAPTP